MRRTLNVPALLLTIGLLVSGCGGGDSDDSGSDAPSEAAPLSQADFVEQADGICADGNKELETAADALGEDPTQEQIEAFAADTLVANIQAQHDAIAELAPPEGDEADVSAILDALQEGLDALSADPSLITQADADPFAEASELAATYGLTECST